MRLLPVFCLQRNPDRSPLALWDGAEKVSRREEGGKLLTLKQRKGDQLGVREGIFGSAATHMDVELYILPLAEASEFVTEELGGKKREKDVRKASASRRLVPLYTKKKKKNSAVSPLDELLEDLSSQAVADLHDVWLRRDRDTSATQVRFPRSRCARVRLLTRGCVWGQGGEGNNVGEATLQRAASTFQINI